MNPLTSGLAEDTPLTLTSCCCCCSLLTQDLVFFPSRYSVAAFFVFYRKNVYVQLLSDIQVLERPQTDASNIWWVLGRAH